jgi:predicted transposase/invertase (TIGR01784 family)
MSKADIRKVMVLMGKLYNGLYKGYKEFEEVNGMVADMLLAELTEAELVGEQRGEQRGEERAKVQFARKLIQKGWDSAEIAETTELDRELVESLMGMAQA